MLKEQILGDLTLLQILFLTHIYNITHLYNEFNEGYAYGQ